MADILQAIASLLWPVVIAAVLVVLLPTIRRFVNQSDSIDVEVAGARISVQKASEELRKLISDLQDRVNELEAAEAGGREDRGTSPIVEPPATPTNRLLWVDDRIEANVYERARLVEAGRRIVQAESTTSALKRLHDDGPFAVIVSDMARVEKDGRINPRAGLDLLEEIRGLGDGTPVVFYSSGRSLSTFRSELDRASNVSYTTSPSELMRLLHVSDGS